MVFSNSVIGHVGSFADQVSMATAIHRLGLPYFVQTPNLHFPIDRRTHLPLVHYLPRTVQAALVHTVPVLHCGRIGKFSDAMAWTTSSRTLTRREFECLFPDGTIVSERVAGLVKSFMVHHGFRAGEIRDAGPAAGTGVA